MKNFQFFRFFAVLSIRYERIPAIITIEEPSMIGHVMLSLNIRTPIMPAKPSGNKQMVE